MALCLIIGYLHINPPLSPSYLQQTEQCFLDGQIPCRWLMESNQGLGFPVFNYISPLPYYASLFFRLLGFNYSFSLILFTMLISLILYVYLKKLSFSNIFLRLLIITLSLLTNSTFPLTFFLLFLHYFPKNHYLSSLFLSLLLISVSNVFIVPILIFSLTSIILLKTYTIKSIFKTFFLSAMISSFYLGPSLISLYQKLPNVLQNSIDQPQVVDGQAYLSEFRKRSNFWRLTVNAATESQALIPVSYHPSWTILIDQKPIIALNNTLYQPTHIKIPTGQHTIVAFLQDSSSTSIFNLITLLSVSYLFVISFPKNVQKNSKA